MVWLGIIMMTEIYVIKNRNGDLMINFITNLTKF